MIHTQTKHTLAQVHHRPYRDEQDLLAMRQLVQNGRHTTDQKLGYLHVGDLSWRFSRSLAFDPQENIHLWEDENGRLVGFAWFTNEHNGVDVQIDPEWKASGLERQIFQWAEIHQRPLLKRLNREPLLRVGCHESQYARQHLLTARGYKRDLFHYVHLWRPLDQPIATPKLMSGFTIRGTRPDEADARAQIHDEAFFVSDVTTLSYAKVMSAPGYMHELDLVAVAPSGRLAAFALCWIDSVNKIGLFEPVGTHPDFRMHGLGKALLCAGLQALKDHGMERAWVYTESPNVPAQRLYTSVGFTVVGKEYDYIKYFSG